MSEIIKTCENCKYDEEPANGAHCTGCIHNAEEHFQPKEVCEWHPIGSNTNWIASCEPNLTHVVFGVSFFKKCPYCGRNMKVGGGNVD